jgi:signal transduction histidine kinase
VLKPPSNETCAFSPTFMTRQLLPPAKVLIIDDEPSNVRLLERMLDLFGGLTYRSTTDSRESVSLFAELQPDLVLTDLHMPHADGYVVIRNLRELIDDDIFLPIVVLTADITPETRRRALGAGASDFITKPLDTTEVQLRIRNLLENRFLNLKLEEQVTARTAELERALEQLRDAQQRVVKQERLSALGTMAGGIAHDFNNALTMVLGYGELLLPWFAANAPKSKEQGYLTNIVAAAQDATHVVARLRDFSRPAEKDDLRVPLNVSQLCEQAVQFTAPKWRIKAQASGVNITVVTEFGEVPNILGSGPELREVLTNLIFNAVDAMPDGGKITVRTQSLPGAVRVDISDSGKGMSPDVKARCLEPFFSTKGERGTGLGLAVVYGIIQRHGGTIEIESEEGKGTTFSLIFPSTSELATEAVQQVEASVSRPLRVLVVDDQEIICELISEHLRADGHDAIVAFDADDATAKFASATIDLVITDQSMPVQSGEQLARSMKAHRPETPIILLTGFGEEMLASGTLPEGIDLILSKPVSSANLRRAIASLAR